MATECPRCVAERRAGQAMFAALVAFVVTLMVGGAASCSLVIAAALRRTDHPDPWLWARGLRDAPPSIAFAVTTAALYAGARRWGRLAAAPLPAPPADPLATYRAAPLECPRHPFAR